MGIAIGTSFRAVTGIQDFRISLRNRRIAVDAIRRNAGHHLRQSVIVCDFTAKLEGFRGIGIGVIIILHPKVHAGTQGIGGCPTRHIVVFRHVHCQKTDGFRQIANQLFVNLPYRLTRIGIVDVRFKDKGHTQICVGCSSVVLFAVKVNEQEIVHCPMHQRLPFHFVSFVVHTILHAVDIGKNIIGHIIRFVKSIPIEIFFRH